MVGEDSVLSASWPLLPSSTLSHLLSPDGVLWALLWGLPGCLAVPTLISQDTAQELHAQACHPHSLPLALLTQEMAALSP